MKLMHRALAAALFASSCTLVSAPAHAVTTVETWAGNASIVGDTCDTTRVQVQGDWDLDYSNEITVDIYGPNGGWQDGDYFSDEYTGNVSVPVRLCKSSPAGTYQIEVVVEGYDEDFMSTGSVTATGTFEFTKRPKRNSNIKGEVHYKPSLRYAYRVPARLLRAGRGYEGKRVLLLARVDGTWFKIDRMRTRDRGKFGWDFKPNRFTWAYVYLGDKTTKAVGVKFTTPRRNARMVRTQVTGAATGFAQLLGDEFGRSLSDAGSQFVSAHRQ